jgi:biofilm PGA synthesis lipoprotein PgaB
MANHQYLPDQQRYETSQEFQQRVRDDVRAVTRTLIETTGRKPRVWVWPYGRASGEALQVIREEGYELFLTLEVGLADVQKPDNVPRLLMTGRDNIESIAALMVDEAPSPNLRVAHIDLDYLYDADPAQQAKNLDLLVQRMRT